MAPPVVTPRDEVNAAPPEARAMMIAAMTQRGASAPDVMPAGPAPKATKSVAEIVQDPAFLGIQDPAEQMKVLERVDPHFRELPFAERAAAIDRLRRGRSLMDAPTTPKTEPKQEPKGERAEFTEAAKDVGRAGVRALDITTSNLAKGLVMAMGMPSDVVELGINALSSYARDRADNPDVGYPDVDLPFGSKEFLAKLPESAKGPKDQTFGERVLGRGIEEIGATAPFLGATLALQGAGKILQQVPTNKLAQISLVLAQSAGMTAEVLKETLGRIIPKPLAEFTGELLGTFGPTTTIKLFNSVKNLAKGTLGIRSEADLGKDIGAEFNKVSSPEEMRAGIEKSEALNRDVQAATGGRREFKPTTGQVSNSPGMIQSERAFTRSSKEAADKSKRTLQQNQQSVREFLEAGAPEGKLEDTVRAIEETRNRETALIDAGMLRAQHEVDRAKQKVSATTERIITQADEAAARAEQAAQARVNALDGRIEKGEAGQIIRREYGAELDTFREQATQRYEQLDPTGETHLPLQPLKDAAAKVRAEFDQKVEKGVRLPEEILGNIDRLGVNWELQQRAEKAMSDIGQIGGGAKPTPLMSFLRSKGGVKDQGGEISTLLGGNSYGARLMHKADSPNGLTLDRAAEAANEAGLIPDREINTLLNALGREVRGGTGMFPSWYQGLVTGKNPMDRPTIETALEGIRTGTLNGLEQKTIDHVRKAIESDMTFRQSTFFHPAMDVVGKDTESFQTLRRLESELHTQIREARAAGNDPLTRRLNDLRDGVKRTMDQLDPELVPEIADHFPGVSERYKEANEFYAKGADRLKAGEAAALREVDRRGRFLTHDENAAEGFLKGETPFNDFVQAIGSREAARDALREWVKKDITEKLVYPDMHSKAGQLVGQDIVSKWMAKNAEAMNYFPEIKKELESANGVQRLADEYRKNADAIRKSPEQVARLKNPKVFGELDDAERMMKDAIALRDRSLKDFQTSLASELLGQDADNVAKVVVRPGSRSRTQLAELNKRIGPDPDGQAGLNRALWDAALDKFNVSIVDAGGNHVLQAKLMDTFLKHNQGWMTERFGPEKVEHMKKTAEMMRTLETTGKPVLGGGSDTMANISSIMTDWGPFLSRVYAEQRGITSMRWLMSERLARIAGKALKGRSEEAARELIEQAFYDPKVAETFMLAARNASEQLLIKRLRFHLGTPFGADEEQGH